MHLLLPILVMCSAIFRRVFSTLLTYRSPREPLPYFCCHHLALGDKTYPAQKALFLRFLSLLPLLYLAFFRREKSERRPREQRQTPRQQKVLFVNICHRLWLFSARSYPREFPSVPFRSLWYIRYCRSPSSWLSCSAGSPKRSWHFGVRFALPPTRFSSPLHLTLYTLHSSSAAPSEH